MKTLKKIILSTCIILYTMTAYSQWTQVNSGTTEDLNDLTFKDTLTGYCVGENGTILKTSNGGDTWIEIFSYSGLSLKTILCGKKDTVIVAGYKFSTGTQAASFLLTSYDAGTSWTVDSTSFQNIYISKLSWAKDTNDFYILGVNKNTSIPSLYQYGNGTLVHLLDSVLQYNFIGGSDTGIILNIDYNTLLKTVDAGTSWGPSGTLAPFQLSNNRDPLHIKFINNSIGLISYHYPSNIIITEDGGGSWNNFFAVSALDMFLVSDSVLYTAGPHGISKIFRLKNSWAKTNYPNPANQSLRDVFFVDENIGYASGRFGIILKTTNGGGTGVGVKENGSFKKKVNIFPNPTKKMIHIETEGKIQFISLILIDNQGKEVRQFKKNEKKLDITGLPTGIYFLHIQAEEGEVMEKIVVQ